MKNGVASGVKIMTSKLPEALYIGNVEFKLNWRKLLPAFDGGQAIAGRDRDAGARCGASVVNEK